MTTTMMMTANAAELDWRRGMHSRRVAFEDPLSSCAIPRLKSYAVDDAFYHDFSAGIRLCTTPQFSHFLTSRAFLVDLRACRNDSVEYAAWNHTQLPAIGPRRFELAARRNQSSPYFVHVRINRTDDDNQMIRVELEGDAQSLVVGCGQLFDHHVAISRAIATEQRLERRRRRLYAAENSPPNVIVVINDAVSRQQFHRRFRRVRHFIESAAADRVVELMRVSSVGWGTRANVPAIVDGDATDLEHPAARRAVRFNATWRDQAAILPLWRHYEALGYRAAYIVQKCFSEEPRRCELDERSFAFVSTHDDDVWWPSAFDRLFFFATSNRVQHHCVGSRAMPEKHFELARAFIEANRAAPYLVVVHQGSAHSPGNAGSTLMDRFEEDFLTRIDLSNTLVYMTSDHGTFGRTELMDVEIRNPCAVFLLPHASPFVRTRLKRHAAAWEQTFVTHHDVHRFFKQLPLLYLRERWDEKSVAFATLDDDDDDNGDTTSIRHHATRAHILRSSSDAVWTYASMRVAIALAAHGDPRSADAIFATQFTVRSRAALDDSLDPWFSPHALWRANDGAHLSPQSRSLLLAPPVNRTCLDAGVVVGEFCLCNSHVTLDAAQARAVLPTSAHASNVTSLVVRFINERTGDGARGCVRLDAARFEIADITYFEVHRTYTFHLRSTSDVDGDAAMRRRLDARQALLSYAARFKATKLAASQALTTTLGDGVTYVLDAVSRNDRFNREACFNDYHRDVSAPRLCRCHATTLAHLLADTPVRVGI